MHWYQQSAERGYAMAMHNVATLYRDGRGADSDLIIAAEWYEKAAHRGNAYSQAMLGWMHENGKGVKQDFVLAAEWYRRAAMQGLSIGQISLGLFYFHGAGVEKDLAEAYKWLLLSANNGHEKAAKYCTEIASQLTEKELVSAQEKVANFMARPVHQIKHSKAGE